MNTINSVQQSSVAMTGDLTDTLCQDVSDLLDVSAVGLYEFIWILRGLERELALDAMRECATAALARLLSDGQSRLVLLRWPSQDALGEYGHAKVGTSDWDDPSDDAPYVAIIRD